MSDALNACASLVERADPDRFAAAMASPVAARYVLFPLYAFNAEVARAPWVTKEPMIAEMRLQWWRDALDEIASGGQVRRHEVATPLGELLTPAQAQLLDKLVAARQWDIYKDPFEDAADFAAYLEATSGHLMWVAALQLGGADETAVRAVAAASGLANFFLAIPALEAAGRKPLVDGRAEAVRALAQGALARLKAADRSTISKPARAATLSAWRARSLLYQAAKDPARVGDGSLGSSEIVRRAGLMRAALFGV